MKQKDFLFVDIISAVFLLLILFTNFFGSLYISNGSITISVSVSVFLVICYYFNIEFLKNNKEQLIKNKLLHFSSIFVLLFVTLSAASFFLMSHFANVEFNCKEKVQNEAYTKLDKIDSLVTLYKSRSSVDLEEFQSTLKMKLKKFKSIRNHKLSNELSSSPYFIDETVLNDPTNIDVEIQSSVSISPIKTKIEQNIKNLDSTIVLNNEKIRNIFINWKRMSLFSEYDQLNDYAIKSKKNIDDMLALLPFNKTSSSIKFDDSKLPLNSPVLLAEKFKPSYLGTFLVILISHIFILIPFILQPIRKYPPPSKGSTKGNNGASRGSVEI